MAQSEHAVDTQTAGSLPLLGSPPNLSWIAALVEVLTWP